MTGSGSNDRRRRSAPADPRDEGARPRRILLRGDEPFRRHRDAGASPPPPGPGGVRGALLAAQEVARVLDGASDLDSAAVPLLEAIARPLGFDLAALWRLDPGAPGGGGAAAGTGPGEASIRCVATWRAAGVDAALEERRRAARHAVGDGLAGATWSSGTAQWRGDGAASPVPPPEAPTRNAGGAFAFAVRDRDAVVAVVELVSRSGHAPDADVARFLEGVGAQVGRFLARRREEESLADSFENAPVGLHWMDERGTILRANRCAAEMLGVEPAALVGRSFASFQDDPAAAEEILSRLARGETLRDVDVGLRAADGTVRCARLTASPAMADGRFTHARCALRDATWQRIAEDSLRTGEARTRAILENALDAYVAVGIDGKILGWNPKAEEMFGRSRAEALGRRLAETIFPLDERRLYAQALERFVRSGEAGVFGRRVETTALRADGSEFPVEMSVTPVRVGEEWTFHAFVRDITERLASERALRASERASRRRAEALRRLALHDAAANPAESLVAVLSDSVGARHVVLAEVEETGGRVRPVAAWTDGRAAKVEEQPLSGSAAEAVLSEGTRYVATGASAAFPRDERLRALAAESYLGAPVVADGGRLRGVLYAVHDRPLDASIDLPALVEMFAARAAEELARRARAAARTAPPRLDRLATLAGSWSNRALATLGLDGRFTSWGAAAADAYGYDAADVAGRSLGAILPPEEATSSLCASLLRLAAEDGLARHDGWCVRKDGTRIWTELTVVALKRDSGEVYGYVLA